MKFKQVQQAASNIYTQLLIVLFLIYLVSSFLTGIVSRAFIFPIFYLAIIITTVRFIRHRNKRFSYLILAGFSYFLDILLALKTLPTLEQQIILISNLLITNYFICLAIFLIGRDLFKQTRVTVDTVLGSICIYFLIGLFFGFFYSAIYELDTDAFSRGTQVPFDGTYFSFVTLTTVGYGGIIPIARIARVLTNIEGMIGTLYPAIIIARLVNLYQTQAVSIDKDHK
jgi:hypothetical protein